MGALPKIKYGGKITEVKIGKTGSEIVLGGETAYNFYCFEGKMPHAPKLALQVLDIEPEEWAPEALDPYKDVLGDPVAWAKKCVEEFGADLVCLWLAGTDPNGKNLSPERAAEVARNVAESIDAPLIVWGVSNDEKNREVLKAVAEACAGYNLVLGPVTEGNYKQVGAAAIAYKHVVAANTPIDVNLAKQLNILLENLGVPNDRILIDPTTGSVGYGLEYCYSIMERIRQAALTQNDDKLQYPIINNIAEEVWKTKEAKLAETENLRLGDASLRGINLEAVTALSVLQAGSDLVVLRHPRTLTQVRKYLQEMMRETDLDCMDVDLSLVASTEAPAPALKAAVTPAAVKEAPVAEVVFTAKEAQAKPAELLAEEIPLVGESVEVGHATAPTPVIAPSCEEETSEKPTLQAPKTIPQPRAAAKTESTELTEADIEALRELLGAFRAVGNLFSAISSLFRSGGS